MGFSTPVLIENWDRTSGTAGENQELVRVINLATTATYSIDKGGCSLGLYEVYVTDALGSNRLYSNFNGVASGSVQLTFNKDGHVVTSGHVNVNMR